MARDEHGPPARGLRAHEVADPADAGRIEPVRRLVEDQHLRIPEQRAGDREPLAHAHRVALHAAIGGALELDVAEHLADTAGRVLSGDGQDPQMVAAGPAGMKGRVFEHGSDVGTGPVELLVAAPPEGRGARRGLHEPEQRPQRRRLARAVGPRKPVTRPGSTAKVSSLTASTEP
jgi:hypothetical protein